MLTGDSQSAARSRGGRFRLISAVAGQASQAFGGLVLSVAAAHLLGAAGLAVFSLVYGAIVLVTALSSGLIGDSLTVLDRADVAVRSALVRLTAVLAVGAGLGAGLLGAGVGPLNGGEALVTGAATTAFMLQDAARRALMAVRRYWRLTAVDALSLVVTVAVIAAGTVAYGHASLSLMLGSLAAGQMASAGLGAGLLPRRLRLRWFRPRPALREVWSFGIWRAAGQAIRPTVLTLMRSVVIVGLGAAAYGPLEAARVYTAPTLVLVTGVGSFLLPHYVAGSHLPARRNLRVADRAAVLLCAAASAVGILAVLLAPYLSPVVAGADVRVPVLAVAGWSVYAAGCAILLPYAQLAAVYRRQRQALMLRAIEAVSLLLVLAVSFLLPRWVSLAPAMLAIGPCLTAAVLRHRVLVPLLGRATSVTGAVEDLPAALRSAGGRHAVDAT